MYKKNRKIWPVVLGAVGLIIVSAIAAVTLPLLILQLQSNSAYKDQLLRGQIYLRDGDYDSAVTAYEGAIELDPRSSDAYIRLAEIYMQTGDYEKAADILDTGLDMVRDSKEKDKLQEQKDKTELQKEQSTSAEDEPAKEEGTDQ